MIISGTRIRSNAKRNILLAIFALVALLLLVLLIVPNRFYKTKTIASGSFYCDMETTKNNKFYTGGQYFKGGKNQSNDFAKSGKYSCKLPTTRKATYGLGFELTNFEPGEIYKASVWRKRPKGGDEGHLNVSVKGAAKFDKSSGDILETVNNWELLEVNFQIPIYAPVESVKIFVSTKGNYDVYFDDLMIQKTGSADSIWQPENIHLDLKYEAYKKLEAKRYEAFVGGLLETKDNDWVNAKILGDTGQAPTKVKMRLKGDWLDHLGGKKWSFRIKTRGGAAFNRLRAFSVHTPKARSFLHEWVLHQLFQQEDVLTTYYDFVNLQVNKNSLGVYAIEEHFDKVLLERQLRREGPIVRFSENGFWAGMKRHLTAFNAIDHGLEHAIKKPIAAPITPFGESKTLKSPLLREQFEQASTLLHQYKMGMIDADQVFDLERMAKYYAICDALTAYHSTAWHNQRFYFNPVSAKLEPIGFDGFREKVSRENYFLGMGAMNPNRIELEKLENLLFLDQKFTTLYSQYLYKYTSRSFLDTFFASIQEGLKARETFLQTEFSGYKFNLDQLIVNAQRLHVMVLPYDDHLLKVYIDKKEETAKHLSITSYHGLPVEIIGFGRNNQIIDDSVSQPMILESFYQRRLFELKHDDTSSINFSFSDVMQAYRNQSPIKHYPAIVSPNINYVFYKTIGIDSVFHSRIHDWAPPKTMSTRQRIFKDLELKSNDWYEVSDQMIYFRAGKHTITNDIIIPNGYRVFFEAGCELDFIKKTKFISQSPVFLNGQSETPVVIRSSDKSAQGFTVLQSPVESKIHYTIFDQFNTLQEEGWKLTGAVTFYESDVNIYASVFKNNVCEDGLNIIRSNFKFDKSLISGTFSDGLDTDFCKGEIQNSTFLNTGNDGMDLSGSVILIKDTKVENAGDKGLSVGEDSDATVISLQVKDSNIGVAAKDLSTLNIRNIKLERCNQGFTAYQKKPEYGGAHIVVKSHTAINLKRLHNIRAGSSIQLGQKTIIGEN